MLQTLALHQSKQIVLSVSPLSNALSLNSINTIIMHSVNPVELRPSQFSLRAARKGD